MSKLFKGLFGKSGSERRQIDFEPVSFTSRGLSGAFDKKSNTFDITRGEDVDTSLQDIVAGFRRREGGLQNLRSRITDTVGGLTRSRINRLRSLRDASVGNVRAELQKRRVAGSKFGLGQIASTELGFAEIEDEIQAEGDLTQLGLEQELIVQETQAGIDAAGVLLGQLNLESGMAANVATASTNAIQANLAASAGISESRRDRNTGIIGGVIGLVGGLLSDARLKDNIRPLGTDIDGINWYTWTWNVIADALGCQAPAIGVIAQELIEQGVEHAVFRDSNGFLRVNYGMLGVAHG